MLQGREETFPLYPPRFSEALYIRLTEDRLSREKQTEVY